MAQKADGKEDPKQKGGGFERATQVAKVLRDREDHVARGLALLGDLGVLDERTQKRLWELYQQGDQATRGFLQEQVARVVPEHRHDSVGDKGETPGKGASVDPLELEVLKQLSSPHVDPGEVARHVRRFDPARLLGGSKDPGALMRYLSDAPLAVHRVQRRLLWAGVSVLLFVVLLLATAVFVPAIVPYVGLGGVVILALFIGILLLRTARWIDRSAKRQGIDLEVYSQLPEDERRLLLVRRIGLRILDPHRKEEKSSPRGEPAAPQVPDPDVARPVPAEAPREPLQETVMGAHKESGTKQTEPPPEGIAVHEEPQEPLGSREPVEAGSPTPRGRGQDDRGQDDRGQHERGADERGQGDRGESESSHDERGQDGTGRLARLVRGARKAWRQAAQSETAHKVGSETRRVSQEAGKRAQQVGRSAHERFSDLRERGEAGLEKRRQARAKKTPSKKRTVKKGPAKKTPAKRTGKKGPAKKTPAKRTGKKASNKASNKAEKVASKESVKRAGKQAGNRGRKAVKKPSVRKGAAKKGAKRSSSKRGSSRR